MSTKKFFSIIIFMLMLTTFFPLVSKNLPKGLGSFDLYALIWFSALAFYHNKLFLNKFFIGYGILFMGLLLNILWVDMDDWNRKGLIREFYYFAVPISVVLYYKMRFDYKGLAWMVKWILIFMAVTSIMTIYSTTIDPLYLRKMVAGDITAFEKFNKLGGGGYGFVSALPALFPIMVYFYRNNARSIFSRKTIVFFGLLSFMAILRGQIFANVVISIIVISFSIWGSKNPGQSIRILLFFLLIVFLIPFSIYADFLISVSSFFDPDSVVYTKLNDTATYLLYGDRYLTGAGGRADRYPLLMKAFVQNPLFGRFVGQQEVVELVGAGGHLYWMNKLTTLGIIGFIPIVLIHYGYIKKAIKYFNKEYTFYFLVAVFSILGLGLMKNLGGRELWFTYFILLPGLYFLPLLKKKRY